MIATATRSRAPSTIWIIMIVVAVGIVLVSFLGQDGNELGGRADPDGFGREGIAAIGVMIERTGGTTTRDVDFPNADHDVAILSGPGYELALAFGADEEQVFGPILDWVDAGGVLITANEVPQGPSAVGQSDETTIEPGLCTIAALDGLDSIATADGYVEIGVGSGTSSCFGDGERAAIVESTVGDGRIIRVAGFEPFFNQVLDEADNGALAARTIGLRDGLRVAFLSGPPPTIGIDGPVDDDGNPIGAGDQGLLELVPRSVIAMILGLAGATLLYAFARGRRLGSPVEEPLPIELPSSSYTEAVGRLYARAENPVARSAGILRHDFRTSAARRVGLSPDAPVDDLAEALRMTTGVDAVSVADALEGNTPLNDEQLADLARTLADHRSRLRRGSSTVPERTSS